MIKQIIFDLDNTLIDTRESIDAAGVMTVEELGGFTPQLEEIHQIRMSGGFNNDWVLIKEMLRRRGQAIELSVVTEAFNKIFLGDDYNGTIRYDEWMLTNGVLKTLQSQFELSVFSGRTRGEADCVLQGKTQFFTKVITDDDVVTGKPDPEGIHLARNHSFKLDEIIYVGDNMDDMNAARSAGVHFIGVVAPGHTNPAELKSLFANNGALTVLENIVEIERVVNELQNSFD